MNPSSCHLSFHLHHPLKNRKAKWRLLTAAFESSCVYYRHHGHVSSRVCGTDSLSAFQNSSTLILDEETVVTGMVIETQGRTKLCTTWKIWVRDGTPWLHPDQQCPLCFLQDTPRRQRSKILSVHTSPRTGRVARLLLGSWAWLISRVL